MLRRFQLMWEWQQATPIRSLTKSFPAIKKHGGISADALRKASAETDLPVGSTLMGYGVNFSPKEQICLAKTKELFLLWCSTLMARQIAWPKPLQTLNPVLPLPKGSPYAK